ncbi:MAG: DUF4007 family protein [Elainella sp.]
MPLPKPTLRSLLSAPNSTGLREARSWAMAAGLLDQRGLTTLGQLVITKDPYLETTVTDWLMHFQLSRNHPFWNYFIYEFLPERVEFTQIELMQQFTKVFATETPERFQKISSLILESYVDAETIGKHRFLVQEKSTYATGNPDLSNPYTTGYLLAEVWKRDFRTRKAVLVDDIFSTKQSLAHLLGISKEHLRQQLSILAKHEIIERRSAQPHLVGDKPQMVNDEESSHQIYRCWSKPEELLEKAYENDKATPNRPLIQALESILDEEDETPDFSQFLEWASELVGLGGGSKTITKLAS